MSAAKKADAWQVTDDPVVLTGWGLSAEVLAKKLLSVAREYSGPNGDGATMLVMAVTYQDEDQWSGTLTVVR
jgi:hypothetical protein